MSQEHILTTPIGAITIVQAQSSDLAVITEILEETALWIESLDIDQWRPGYFLGTSSQLRMAQNISDGEAYLVLYEEQVIGTITVQAGSAIDEELWGNETLKDALYVHRLALRRAFARKGIGYMLLHWAEGLATHAGKTYLRLDCMADNAALCTYYERDGFICRGIIGENWKSSIYEKSVSFR
ncbi:MAG TPA: GNAT family N-acetyltransferase [Ktedonobacteraceae bacterium]|nr:GNAT family N-acetyltransferase [Ktedonobacteraceae bacterium]